MMFITESIKANTKKATLQSAEIKRVREHNDFRLAFLHRFTLKNFVKYYLCTFMLLLPKTKEFAQYAKELLPQIDLVKFMIGIPVSSQQKVAGIAKEITKLNYKKHDFHIRIHAFLVTIFCDLPP